MSTRILGITALITICSFATPVSAKTATEVPLITPTQKEAEVHEIFLKPGEYLEAPALGSDGKVRIIRIFSQSCSPIPETPAPAKPIPVMPASVTGTP